MQTDAIKAAAREAAKAALKEARLVAEPSSGGDGASSSGTPTASPALASDFWADTVIHLHPYLGPALFS